VRGWLQKLKSSGLVFPIILIAALGGQRAYMNLRAADPLPVGFARYTPDGFAEAQAAGGPILVDVYASWCPTCAVQHKALATLLSEAGFAEVRGFRVDYDRDRSFVRAHRIPGQSTILVFHGGLELNRSIGVTDAGSIRRQLAAALAAIRAAP
jgi:thiol:disulfide interchange protein